MLKLSLSVILFATIVALNGYKLIDLRALINQEGLLGIGWKVYNWMKDGQVSSSYLGWLFFHNFIGIIHYFNTLLYLILKNPTIKASFDLTHLIFCLWIFPNLIHFGEYPWYIALAGNGFPYAIILLSHDRMALMKFLLSRFDQKIPRKWLGWSHWIYLVGLSLAPLLEIYFVIHH